MDGIFKGGKNKILESPALAQTFPRRKHLFIFFGKYYGNFRIINFRRGTIYIIFNQVKIRSQVKEKNGFGFNNKYFFKIILANFRPDHLRMCHPWFQRYLLTQLKDSLLLGCGNCNIHSEAELILKEICLIFSFKNFRLCNNKYFRIDIMFAFEKK